MMAEEFEGLLYIPATDLNFTGGIQRLSDDALAAMLERLTALSETEDGHKGRIKAVFLPVDASLWINNIFSKIGGGNVH
ncbi:MAG: hypothetical protein Ta2A_23640 [Treponemataceae bacterium]|nr:MAG: hypothetical protein Ta2A_23640 [Treponemataceae bacterium]